MAEISNDNTLLFLKVVFVFLCPLFLPLFSFFFNGFLRGKDHGEKEYYETSNTAAEVTETPCSALSFRFPTYDEFISKKNFESDIFEESFSLSISDTDSTSSSQEFDDAISSSLSDTSDPENSPENDESCINDSRNAEDEEHEDESSKSRRLRDEESKDSIKLGWEDEKLMEELKLMKKTKTKTIASNLSPIPEESAFSETLNHRDAMDELLKVHRIYREKMKKYDTLNYQKTFQIEMKKSKGSVESPLCRSLWLCGPRTQEDGKPKKGREVEEDMEMVYVGQLCLSWDFILWQYSKAIALCKTVPLGRWRYNKVADKLQYFQVLIKRFMENEANEGSRVQYYAKCRLVRRKLLQVPVIREDKVKKEGRKVEDEEDAITMNKLVEIMQESIRIFWKFIRADKHTNTSTILKSQMEDCKNPAKSNIPKQILSDLHKKERKVKKMIKRRKWRLKEDSEEDPNEETCFLAMAALKLVARAVNMRRISEEQISWCDDKLSSIRFLNRKIKVEPSLFLFSD